MANSRTLGFNQCNRAAALTAALSLLVTAGCGPQLGDEIGSTQAAARVKNPFLGVTGYVNPDWKAHALAEPGGERVANVPTAVWLDSIAAVVGANGSTSLRQHLDNVLAQGAGYIEVVLYDLPGRDCPNLVTNGELGSSDLTRYQSEFVDPIAVIEGDAKYASLRIVNIIEPDSLPNLLTSVSTTRCGQADTASAYLGGVQYALGKLGAIPNVYNFLDIGSHGLLGWEVNFDAGADLFTRTVKGAAGGFGTVAGLVSNVANYGPTVEPFFTATTVVGGLPARQSKWVDWASYVDEQGYALAMREALIKRGFSSNLGVIIDTSRNGWGGASRPTAPSTSTNVDTFVNASRVDRRFHTGNWCNQSGAGLGERPKIVGNDDVFAYVWIKAPGESDGSSQAVAFGVDNPQGKGFDAMCDPNYKGNARNANNPTGALPGAPAAGMWFSTAFQQLMANAYPPLDAVAPDTTPPEAPTDLSWNDSDGTVVLSWVAPAYGSGLTYRLFYGSYDLGVFADTSVAIIGFKPGTPYTFTVKAVDPAGNVSLASNAVTVLLPIPKDTTPPTRPDFLTLSSTSWSTATLSWTASTDDVGVVVYQIYSDDVLYQTVPATTSAVLSLIPNRIYRLSVKAVDGAGNVSPASNVLRVVVGEPPNLPPSAPSKVHVTGGTATTVSLGWMASTDEVGVVRYDVFAGGTLVATSFGTSVTVSNLATGATYAFTVTALDSADNVSAASNTLTVMVGASIPPQAPAAPTQLQASNTAGTPVQLAWTPGTGGTPATTYRVYRDGLLVLTTTLTSVVVTAVAGSTTYGFTVRAVDELGSASEASAPATITTSKSFDTDPPGRPSHLKVTQITGTSVSLAWTASTDNVGVIAYEVFARGVLVGMATGTSTTITNLLEGVSYDFTVKALDAVCSVSQESAAVTATVGGPLESWPPTTPTNLTVQSVAPWTVALTWTGSRDADSWVAGYDVYVKYVNGSTVTLVLAASSMTTAATVNGLYAGTYSLVVRARDAVGNESSDSNTVTVTIPSP